MSLRKKKGVQKETEVQCRRDRQRSLSDKVIEGDQNIQEAGKETTSPTRGRQTATENIIGTDKTASCLTMRKV